jgi:hypothetical protein
VREGRQAGGQKQGRVAELVVDKFELTKRMITLSMLPNLAVIPEKEWQTF